MMKSAKRYWVVGGDYSDTSFDSLVDGTGQVVGPFDDEAEAHRVWQQLATETRSACCTRFSIAEENVR